MYLRRAPAIEYADLEIRILERQPAGYPVEITFSGEQEFPRGYLAPNVLPWVSSASPTEDGERLFGLLFADDMLKTTWAQVRGQNHYRRIRLRIDDSAPELHAVPWELLREVGPGFVPQTWAANAATPFSRYLAGQWRPGRPIQSRPVKLLAAIANPSNLAEYRLPEIKIEDEHVALTAALAGLSEAELELTFVTQPVTLSAIEAALKEGGDHILHIIAHGIYLPKSGQASLFLAGDDGRVARVVENEFAEMLMRQGESLRLIFLASCQTATRSSADAFRGFAPRLVDAGVPAVMAMQDLVPIATARAFAGTFYRQLMRHGLVDVASNEARSALLSAQESGSWAVPVLFSRLPEGMIVLPEPARRYSLRDRLAIGALLLAIALAVVLVWQPFRTRPMGSGFNVVVAQFVVQDATGRLSVSEDSRNLSAWLYSAIQKETEQLPPELQIELRGPEEVGVIDGQDRAARAASAARIAARHNATLLIYGVIMKNDNGLAVEPEFYVAAQSFGYGSEVAGSDRLGQPVPVRFPLDPPTLATINKQLNDRARSLRYIISGLAQFYFRRYNSAWADFQDAAAITPEGGKEVVYLLIGAAKLRASDQESDPLQREQALVQASDAFSQSYRLKPDYARSYLGLGAVAMAQAKIGNTVNAAKLLEATRWYSAGLSAPDQPASAYVPEKAAFGLGQAHLLGIEQNLPGWSGQRAWQLFTQVAQAYDADQALDLAWFAGHAHAYLGLLAGRNSDWESMASECRRAIDILKSIPNPPANWIALYWTWVGAAEKKQGRLDAARAAYRQAIETGTGAVGADKLKQWQGELDQIGQGVQ